MLHGCCFCFRLLCNIDVVLNVRNKRLTANASLDGIFIDFVDVTVNFVIFCLTYALIHTIVHR